MQLKKRFLILVSVVLFTIVLIVYYVSRNDKIIYNKADENSIATVLPEDKAYIYHFPKLGKSFTGFKEAIGFKESRNDYNCVNTLGYLGKYQFGKSTLRRLRIYNSHGFLKDAELQEEAFIALCSVNKWILRKDIKRKVGKKINGILITESGILAASHLAGAGNVKKYLRTNGQNNVEDAYGSNIEFYIKKFAGYDTSMIVANKNARI